MRTGLNWFYQNVPQWLLHFNFNNWVARTWIFRVYELKMKRGEKITPQTISFNRITRLLIFSSCSIPNSQGECRYIHNAWRHPSSEWLISQSVSRSHTLTFDSQAGRKKFQPAFYFLTLSWSNSSHSVFSHSDEFCFNFIQQFRKKIISLLIRVNSSSFFPYRSLRFFHRLPPV